MYQGKPFSVELPNTVELVIVDCPPSIKGANGEQRRQGCEAGDRVIVVNVPDFIEQGTDREDRHADGQVHAGPRERVSGPAD